MTVGKALEIVKRAIKAVAGKGQPPSLQVGQTLESLGISTSEALQALKHQLNDEVASAGYVFTKMSIEGLQRSHTVEQAADLVRHAQPVGTPTMY